MLVPNRHGSNDPNGYRYGFQGQEKDDELKGEGNSLNFKYRIDDTRIGRFFAVDPMAKKYPYYSPYAFGGNKVIQFIEFEGLETKESGVTKFAIPAKQPPIAPPAVALIGAGLKSMPMQQVISETSIGLVESQGSQLLLKETVVESAAEGVVETIGSSFFRVFATLFAILTPTSCNEQQPKFEYKSLTGGISATAPSISAIPENDVDDSITLYRGVSSAQVFSNKVKMRQYLYATQGIAMPIGMLQDPENFFKPHEDMDDHAMGDNNSIWTSWSASKETARHFAGGPENNAGGIILEKKFKIGSEAVPNISPTAQMMGEGEWLVPGVVRGAKTEKVIPLE
jgi:hypothetical protein